MTMEPPKTARSKKRKSTIGRRIHLATNSDLVPGNVHSGRKRIAAMALLMARKNNISIESAVRKLGAEKSAIPIIVELGREMAFQLEKKRRVV